MKVLVAGGGPAGLYTGWKLLERGHDVTVLERESRVGGLAASIKKGSNYYSYGTHHLHSPDPEKIRPFKELMGPSLIALERRLSIKFMGRFYPYPLKTKNLIRGLPFPLLAASAAGLAKVIVLKRFKAGKPANAEEAIIDLYGRKLYEIMFRDYTTRFWGVPPSKISSTFVDKRMPGIQAVEKIKRALAKVGLTARNSLGKTVTIGSGKMYTTARGAGAVFEAIAETIQAGGGQVMTSSEVVAVHGAGNEIQAVTIRRGEGEETLPCDLLVSTLPLNHLAQRLDPPAPVRIQEAAGRLGFRGLLVIGLIIRPVKRLNAMFTYFPDRSFHRLAEVAHPPAEITPDGCTQLLAEITCDVGDPVWNDPSTVESKIVKDLVEEGLVCEDQIKEIHYFKAAEAYPRYSLGFEKDLEAIENHLGSFSNLVSTGRQGAFQFTNMMQTMTMAWHDTQKNLERMDKPIFVKGA